ncbi:hypothetical protein [Hyphococcus sp.]
MPDWRACIKEFCVGCAERRGRGSQRKDKSGDFIAAGKNKMMGSDHKEANGMAVRHACFMMKATHINYRKPAKPEKAPQYEIAIVGGEVA